MSEAELFPRKTATLQLMHNLKQHMLYMLHVVVLHTTSCGTAWCNTQAYLHQFEHLRSRACILVLSNQPPQTYLQTNRDLKRLELCCPLCCFSFSAYFQSCTDCTVRPLPLSDTKQEHRINTNLQRQRWRQRQKDRKTDARACTLSR